MMRPEAAIGKTFDRDLRQKSAEAAGLCGAQLLVLRPEQIPMTVDDRGLAPAAALDLTEKSKTVVSNYVRHRLSF